MISHERVLALLEYDPDTGKLFWRERVGPGGSITAFNRRYAGTEAGYLSDNGSYNRIYIKVTIKPDRFYAHRLIWFMQTSEWPEDEIDHINGDGTDNRWANLRKATRAQNMKNHSGNAGGTQTGYRGVSFSKNGERFVAKITVDQQQLHLGVFDTAEEAYAAYEQASLKHFGEWSPLAQGNQGVGDGG